MNSLLKKLYLILLVSFPIILSSCSSSTTLHKQTIKGGNKNWSVEVKRIRSGPDSYVVGDMTYYPKNKSIGIIWFNIIVTNKTKKTRLFDFSKWGIQGKGYTQNAVRVYSTNFFSRLGDSYNISPGSRVNRWVGCMYRKGVYPHILTYKFRGEMIRVKLPRM